MAPALLFVKSVKNVMGGRRKAAVAIHENLQFGLLRP
jgi:hypothetical protein